jgi:hypothetical protein
VLTAAATVASAREGPQWEGAAAALQRARTRADVTTLPTRYPFARACAGGRCGARVADGKPKAREALREPFGEIVLEKDDEGVYAEFDNAAESLMLAVGALEEWTWQRGVQRLHSTDLS